MTLIITELRDDVPPGPDPNFNPNVFSEDEEEAIALEERKRMHVCSTDHAPPIAPMSPRGNRLARPKSGNFLEFPPIPALARAESYEDEFPETLELRQENLRPTSITPRGVGCSNSIRNGVTTNNGRHAISPLCCEGSVPALQSPKNAVAPSDIIFDRPPVQSMVSYSTPDYVNHVKAEKNNLEKQVKKVEVKEQITWKEKCANTKNSSNLIGMEVGQIKFIDEESGDQGTSIPKSVSNAYLSDSMVRSCSVGYLDLVDAQLVPCNLALLALRKDAPKRLVLVNRKKQRRKKQSQDIKDNLKSPKLSNCGKSKSLDSSDLFPTPDIQSLRLMMPHKEETTTDSKKSPETTETPEIKSDPVSSKTSSFRRKKSDSKESTSKSSRGRKTTTVPQNEEKSTPLHTHALNTLENLLTRLRDLDDSRSTPPSSPRLPRSSPASPAPTKKGKRPQSASPIRKHLLNSPLLGRRSRKSKLTESSDDEVAASGDEVYCGKNFKDLESFQKAQLRQKVSPHT